MFRSIEYKLLVYIVVLVLTTGLSVWLFAFGMVPYSVGAALITAWSVYKLWRHYRKFNRNILFLLNALENGDYSFHFSEGRVSVRERELNAMLNRIKQILAAARTEVIENEKFLSVIVESVSTGIVILDDNNSVRTVNRAAAEILGLRVFTHINQLSAIDSRYPDIFKRLTAGQTAQISIANEREDMQVALRASSVTLKNRRMKVVTLSSIGNELEAREMESWIKLIRVMTHEIMNSIAPISSLTETMLSFYGHRTDVSNTHSGFGDGSEIDSESIPPANHKSGSDSVHNAGTQSETSRFGSGIDADTLRSDTIETFAAINSTAKGLLTFVDSYRRFTGIPKPRPSRFDLVRLTREIVALESALKPGIRMDISEPSGKITVMADQSQIGQVLTNLIKNAAEAVDGRPGGRIMVRFADQKGAVKMDVCNNGEMIPDDVLPHIFVPFFTTKESGSGIGLSLSRYIMRQHGGNIYHHREGELTVFTITFSR